MMDQTSRIRHNAIKRPSPKGKFGWVHFVFFMNKPGGQRELNAYRNLPRSSCAEVATKVSLLFLVFFSSTSSTATWNNALNFETRTEICHCWLFWSIVVVPAEVPDTAQDSVHVAMLMRFTMAVGSFLHHLIVTAVSSWAWSLWCRGCRQHHRTHHSHNSTSLSLRRVRSLNNSLLSFSLLSVSSSTYRCKRSQTAVSEVLCAAWSEEMNTKYRKTSERKTR